MIYSFSLFVLNVYLYPTPLMQPISSQRQAVRRKHPPLMLHSKSARKLLQLKYFHLISLYFLCITSQGQTFCCFNYMYQIILILKFLTDSYFIYKTQSAMHFSRYVRSGPCLPTGRSRRLAQLVWHGTVSPLPGST